MNAIPDYCSTSKDVIDWLETAYSNEVNRRFIESCIGCYEWAIRTERTDANPFNRYKTHFPKRSRPQCYAFTSDERNAIIKAFHLEAPQFYPYISFCFRTGCRHEEARGLEWNGVKSTYIHFYQAVASHFTEPTPLKTNDTRTFPITPKIQAILDQQRGISARWVFPSLTDKPIDGMKFRSRHWVPILDALQKKGHISQYLPPKHTRYTFITLSLREGKDVTDIAKLVGNSSAFSLTIKSRSREFSRAGLIVKENNETLAMNGTDETRTHDLPLRS
jgi:integrase